MLFLAQASSFHLSALQQQASVQSASFRSQQSDPSPADSKESAQESSGPDAIAVDWARGVDFAQAREDFWYFDKIMTHDLGGNCHQRRAAEGREVSGREGTGGMEGETRGDGAAQAHWLRRGDNLVLPRSPVPVRVVFFLSSPRLPRPLLPRAFLFFSHSSFSSPSLRNSLTPSTRPPALPRPPTFLPSPSL